ncbi:MAG: Ig-like domain-containing protein [Bacilli bacterium]|nr:Ig-like domain-containing protein [Bacilli bacterium]
MKKLFLLILFYIILIPNVYAEEKTVFSIESKNSAPGKEVTINVSMRNNPKFELLSFQLPIDTTQVEFLECNVIGLKKATLKGCSINPYNTIVFYALTMYADEDKLLTNTGKIAEIHLKVKEGANKDVPLSLNITDYGKSDTEKLDYEIENGYIRIAGDIKTKVINEKEDLSKELGKNVGTESITWESSDEETATVDPEGNVEFRGSGNATIIAKDVEGNIVYKKNYFVNTKDNHMKEIKIVIPIVLISSLLLFFLFNKKRKLKNEN